MEITLDAIISLIGLFVGGGGGAFFMWRYQRKKAKAEAESAEIDAAKELQGMYQTMLADANKYLEDARDKVDGLRQERDHYKQDRNELRERLDETDAKIRDLQINVARNGRQIEMMRPFICTKLDCKLRQRGTISADGEVKNKRQKKVIGAVPPGICDGDIEPSNDEL